jgi:hypothetical protein
LPNPKIHRGKSRDALILVGPQLKLHFDISYEKLIGDALRRHRMLFKKLGLPTDRMSDCTSEKFYPSKQYPAHRNGFRAIPCVSFITCSGMGESKAEARPPLTPPSKCYQ